MNDLLFITVVSLIPFTGTAVGSLCALFIRKTNGNIQNLLYGFSGGIMISASIFSLLIPSIEATLLPQKWLVPSLGLAGGVLFMLVVDYLSRASGGNDLLSNKMVTAITFHNLPEGMAMGVTISNALVGGGAVLPCIMLAIGIAVQNVPEGAIISLPLVNSGASRIKSVGIGIFSAVVELSGCVIALVLTTVIVKLLPFLLALSAGAMIWVTVKELIPESAGISGTVLFMLGFIVMLILDLA